MAAPVQLVRVPTAPEKRLAEMVGDAFGPLLRKYIADPTVEDVGVNADGVMWVKFRGKDWEAVGEMAEQETNALINSVSGLRGAIVNRDSPVLSTELPEYGLRFEGWRPPIVTRASFCIRRSAAIVFPLEEYVDKKIITAVQYEALVSAIRSHLNILLAGGPGSGKTTLLNSLLASIALYCPQDRIITIEDTMELLKASPNTQSFHAKDGLTYLDCLRTVLRARGTRIAVGEVRGEEANDMLKAWNTGHAGCLATLHASSARQALSRLESLVRESPRAVRNAKNLIADSVQMVIYLSPEEDREMYPAGRRVREILAVTGLRGSRYQLEEVA